MAEGDDSKQSQGASLAENEELMEKFRTLAKGFVPYDPRFPNQNQTKNCQINYLDYHRCLRKTNDEDYCAWYKKAYLKLCPREWYEKWDDQRENGTFAYFIDWTPHKKTHSSS